MVLLLLNGCLRCPSYPALCLETYPTASSLSLWSMAGLPPRDQPKATVRNDSFVGRIESVRLETITTPLGTY